jgi:hypothetical protein
MVDVSWPLSRWVAEACYQSVCRSLITIGYELLLAGVHDVSLLLYIMSRDGSEESYSEVCAYPLPGCADARTGGIFSLLGWSAGQISAFGNKLMYNAAKRLILWRTSGGSYPGFR